MHDVDGRINRKRERRERIRKDWNIQHIMKSIMYTGDFLFG
jgi:hypothetical protein